MNVNFEYYKIFYYVAKYNNFTKAAHVLNNSQPNITRAMNCLEHELNCTLFVRTNRGVCLTPEGERLFTRVSAAMTQLQLAEEELSDSVRLEHGSISIGASETALNIYLLEHLKKFHIAYPGVRLKICNHSTPQAIRSVRSGEIDFAVVTTPTQLDAPLKELKLKSFQEILIGGKTFTSLATQKFFLKDLIKYPFICLGLETATYHFYYNLFLSHGIELIPDTEAATTDQIIPMVIHNLGIGFCPEKLAKPFIESGDILQIPLIESELEREICLIQDISRGTSIAVSKLINMLIED